MRKHNRFHSDVTIDRKNANTYMKDSEVLHDISVDGLCFQSSTYFNIGREMTLEISVIKPGLRVKARVVWCHKRGNLYDTGVEFVSIEKGSCIRTVEFLQFLDQYKRDLFLNEGRRLTSEEVFSELMDKHASQAFLH